MTWHNRNVPSGDPTHGLPSVAAHSILRWHRRLPPSHRICCWCCSHGAGEGRLRVVSTMTDWLRVNWLTLLSLCFSCCISDMLFSGRKYFLIKLFLFFTFTLPLLFLSSHYKLQLVCIPLWLTILVFHHLLTSFLRAGTRRRSLWARLWAI